MTRDDLLVGDPEFWIGAGNTLLVEEKVDGGNLGITCDTNHTLMYQNRSHHVNEASHPQWVGLERWADEFGTALAKILEPERRVLFGEWCTTVHSLEYTRLPSHFIAFDMYDRVTGAWYTRAQLHDVLKDTGIPVVPVLTERAFNSRDELITLLETSRGTGTMARWRASTSGTKRPTGQCGAASWSGQTLSRGSRRTG